MLVKVKQDQVLPEMLMIPINKGSPESCHEGLLPCFNLTYPEPYQISGTHGPLPVVLHLMNPDQSQLSSLHLTLIQGPVPGPLPHL